MKREILFRGKSVITGEWVFSMTLAKGTIKRKFRLFYLQVDDEKWVQVIPETIGQFTGRIDKKGRKIFEGDVVDSKYFNGHVVEFWSNQWTFSCGISHYSFNTAIHSFEVTGNIHDNASV